MTFFCTTKKGICLEIKLLFEVFNFILTFYTAAGLDASTARKLLMFLHGLVHPSGIPGSTVRCKRAVILTIHQPRLEIFHMFDKLLLLSEGKVSYL